VLNVWRRCPKPGMREIFLIEYFLEGRDDNVKINLREINCDDLN
jgi:hypothetical protein